MRILHQPVHQRGHGGALGGWVDGLFDSQTVFLAGALLATVWLLVAGTMKEAALRR